MSKPDTSGRGRIEILCLTYGEPPEHEFLPQFQYSLSILNRLTRRVAPIPKFVTPLLAARRGLIRKASFREKGYHSPLEAITARQVAGLREALARLRPGVDFRVRMVCEFRPPYLQTILRELAADPPAEIILLPMYLAESDFTWGISRTDCAQFHARRRGRNPLPPPRIPVGFGFDERLAEAVARFVWSRVEAAGWSPEKCKRSALILGAHGTLQFPPPGINSGALETRYFFGLLRRHLRPRFRTVRIGWLNHKLGGKWTFPEVAESARECWDAGDRTVVYFPFGFLADNAESQLEGPAQLAEFAWEDLLHVECPNDDAGMIDFMARRVVESLASPRGDWETIEQGTPELIQKERPAPKGKPGLLRYNAAGLAVAAGAFWLAIGLMLTIRGAVMGIQHLGPLALALAALFGAVVGWAKGQRILAKMARKNLVRLRRIAQPSPLLHMFSKATWCIVFFFAGLGMAIRFSPLPYWVRSPVLMAVGLAMVVGAAEYARGLGRVREPIASAAQPMAD